MLNFFMQQYPASAYCAKGLFEVNISFIHTANIFMVIFTVSNCVQISTVILLYNLHLIAAPSTVEYRGSPTSTVPTSTISTSTNFIAIGIKLVLVEFLWNCYVVKLVCVSVYSFRVLVEIDYVVLNSTNFALYDFFKIPKIVLSEDPLYINWYTQAKKFVLLNEPLYLTNQQVP